MTEPDRTARYSARVDERLAATPSVADRRAFLKNELAKWEDRFGEFMRSIDSGEPTNSDETAWDYVNTICALNERLAKIPEHEHA